MFLILLLSILFGFSPNLALNHAKVIQPSNEAAQNVIMREYHYNYDEIETLIKKSSLPMLCIIAQRQLLCSLYCNERIAYDTDSICDEYSLPQNNNWGLFKPYIVYREFLSDSYQRGTLLISLVEKYLKEIDFTLQNNKHHFDTTKGLPTIYALELEVKELYQKLKKQEEFIEKIYNVLIERYPLVYVKLSKEEQTACESLKFIEHLYDQQAVIKTWLVRFEDYQALVGTTPDIKDVQKLQSYYETCQQQNEYLKKTTEHFARIRGDVSCFLSAALLKWDYILSNAYKSIETLLTEIQSPHQALPSSIQEHEELTAPPIKKFWDDCILEIACFYNDLGYYASEQQNPQFPTIEDLRDALCKINSCLRNLLSCTFFSKKVSPSLKQQLDIAKIIGSYPRVLLQYSSITVQEVQKDSLEIKIINPRTYSAASSTQLSPPTPTISSPYESDNESVESPSFKGPYFVLPEKTVQEYLPCPIDESFFKPGMYETAHGELTLEEMEKQGLLAQTQQVSALLPPS